MECHTLTNKSTIYNEVVNIDFYTLVKIVNNDKEVQEYRSNTFGQKINRLRPDQKPSPRPVPSLALHRPKLLPSLELALSQAPGTWKPDLQNVTDPADRSV